MVEMDPPGIPMAGDAGTLEVEACTNNRSFWFRVLNAAARAGDSLVEDLTVHHNRSSPEEHPAVNKENIFWCVAVVAKCPTFAPAFRSLRVFFSPCRVCMFVVFIDLIMCLDLQLCDRLLPNIPLVGT